MVPLATLLDRDRAGAPAAEQPPGVGAGMKLRDGIEIVAAIGERLRVDDDAELPGFELQCAADARLLGIRIAGDLQADTPRVDDVRVRFTGKSHHTDRDHGLHCSSHRRNSIASFVTTYCGS